MNLFDTDDFWHGENDHKWSTHPDTVNRAINCMRESMWLKLTNLFNGVEPSNNDIIGLIREENRLEKSGSYTVVWINENLPLEVWI